MGTPEGKSFTIQEIPPVPKVAHLSPAPQFQPAIANGVPCMPAHLSGNKEQDQHEGG